MLKKTCLLNIIIIILIITSISWVSAIEIINTTVQSNDKLNIDLKESDIALSSNEHTINNGSFEEIKETISKANDGDIIYLNGKFNAENNDSIIHINKQLTITSNSEVTLDGCNVSGIFYLRPSAAGTTISGIKFINGYRTIGSAIFINTENVTLDNCIFENNTAYNYGGGGAVCTAYDLEKSQNLLVKNSIFKGNSAPVSSGALAAYGNNSQIINCVFDKNYGFEYSNYSTYEGALQVGINNKKSKNYIINCTFLNNSAKYTTTSSSGGATGIREGTIISNSKFINNNAKNGGAIIVYNTGEIINCEFINNNAENGGAIETQNTTITIKNSEFYNNHGKNGGAISTQNSSMKIMNSKFTANTGDKGGSINNQGKIEISDCEFINNTATEGGNIFSKNKIKITNSNFNTNNADKGGTISNYGELEIQNTNFKNNTAKNGGAIYTKNILKINNSNFEFNTAEYGGAINSQEATITINNSIFKSHSSKYEGAIYTNQTTLTVINTQFINNTAEYGGAIYTNDSNGNIINSNFAHNIAKNGSAVYNNGKLNMINSKFKNNQANSYKLISKNYTIKKDKTVKIVIYLEYGDNYPGVYNNNTLTINNKTPSFSSGAPNQEIILKINKKIYTLKTNKKGKTTLKLSTKKLKVKKYTFTLNHPQSNISTKIHNKYTLKITQKKTTSKKSKSNKTNKNKKKSEKSKKRSIQTYSKNNQKNIPKIKNVKQKSIIKTKNSKKVKIKTKQIKLDKYKCGHETLLDNPGLKLAAKGYNKISDFLNKPLFTIGNYKKTLKKWGWFGKGIGIAADVLLGIDENGNLSIGDAILNVVSLACGAGILLRGAKIGTKFIKIINKSKNINKILKVIKNKYLIKIFNNIKNSSILFNKKAHNFIIKIYKKLPNRIKNSKLLKLSKNLYKIGQKNIKKSFNSLKKVTKNIKNIGKNIIKHVKNFGNKIIESSSKIKNFSKTIIKKSKSIKIAKRIWKKYKKPLNILSDITEITTSPITHFSTKLITSPLTKYIGRKTNIVNKTINKMFKSISKKDNKKAIVYLNRAYKQNKPIKIAKSINNYFLNPYRTIYNIIFPNLKLIKKNFKNSVEKIRKKTNQHKNKPNFKINQPHRNHKLKRIRRPNTRTIRRPIKTIKRNRRPIRIVKRIRRSITRTIRRPIKTVKRIVNKSRKIFRKLKFW